MCNSNSFRRALSGMLVSAIALFAPARVSAQDSVKPVPSVSAPVASADVPEQDTGRKEERASASGKPPNYVLDRQWVAANDNLLFDACKIVPDTDGKKQSVLNHYVAVGKLLDSDAKFTIDYRMASATLTIKISKEKFTVPLNADRGFSVANDDNTKRGVLLIADELVNKRQDYCAHTQPATKAQKIWATLPR